MAIEMIFIKILLAVYSPVALYTIRTFLVFVVLAIFLRPNFEGLNYKKTLIMAGTAFLAVIQMVLIYTSVGREGLVFTTLILILTPILIFIFSIIFYKEKFSIRTLILYIIIIACIAAASFFENR
jgi:drug/metabolite transporter (DMT)-like permease